MDTKNPPTLEDRCSAHASGYHDGIHDRRFTPGRNWLPELFDEYRNGFQLGRLIRQNIARGCEQPERAAIERKAAG